MSEILTIDGVGPMPVERPSTVAEVCAIVRRCAETKTAIYPVGGGTMLDYGMPPARVGIALTTSALNQVIDYPARDLTITVQAGITVQKLQDTLAAENQWLPIDVPSPETATLGGAIACDVSGPRRHGYGTLRDYVIGLTVVNDRGQETHAGGRVVKNVAGYDMMKLHTGALGTLGVITQVTLKVKPKPEQISLVAVTLSLEQLHDLVTVFQKSHTRPSWVMVSNAAAFLDATGRKSGFFGWQAMVGFDGSSESTNWQCERCVTELSDASLVGSGGPVDAAYHDQISQSLLIPPRIGPFSALPYLRVRLPLATLTAFCRRASQINEQSFFAVDLPGGVVWIGLFAGDGCAVDTMSALGQAAIEFGGFSLLERCPTEWKKSLPVWGHPPADLALQKAVKRALDPQNILNPGRFVTDRF